MARKRKSMNRIKYSSSIRKDQRPGDEGAIQRNVNAHEARMQAFTKLRPTVHTSAGKKNAISGHSKRSA